MLLEQLTRRNEVGDGNWRRRGRGANNQCSSDPDRSLDFVFADWSVELVCFWQGARDVPVRSDRLL